MKGFYSPIDRAAEQLPRTKGTGAEFMTELSKRPGYKPQEAQDRELQTLMALPKMERAQFLQALKSKPAPQLEESTLAKSILKNRGLNVLPDEPTKYEDYSLPGGSNYREILLRMPHDEQRAKEFSDPASGHWDQPNVLAHVRAKDRTGPNGEKILHLEEIQSDWHQQGRDRGYATPESLQQFKAAQLAHRRLKEQLEEAKGNSENIDKKLSSGMPLYQDPEVRQRMEAAKVEHNNKIMDLMPQVMKAQAEAQDLGHRLNNVVPNAPFKKNWHELALKKMIHHAAANGYDSIAITPGQEQAKRYSLSRQVGRITHMTHSDTPDKGILFAFDPKGNQIVENHNVFHKDLPRYIGKEGAQKLLEQKPDEHGYRELSGQNLEVGGEGMKGFYDKMIPSFLNQFGKKYGAQVGTMHMPVGGATEDDVIESFPGGIHDAMRAGDVGARQYIAKKLAEVNRAVPLHHFPITPEMREDVTQNGVPLYAKGGVAHMAGGSIEYQGEHKPPSESYGAPLHDLTQVYPEDIYSNKALQYYGMGHPEHKKMDMESLFKAQMYRNKPNASVSVFRAVPEHVNEINPKDWVTLSPAYAKLHGESRLGGKYKTLKKMVKAKELWTAGDSIHEWGYHPEEKKAAGGEVKPIGYTKEKVTVSPNLDAMRYELMSVKHYVKKAK